jgi:hypothetical protein
MRLSVGPGVVMSVAVSPKPKSIELVAPDVKGPSYSTRFVPELVAVGSGVGVGELVALGGVVGAVVGTGV